MSTAADKAVGYVLGRIWSDPRLAYYFGHTEALDLLLVAKAEAGSQDLETLRNQFSVDLRTERPRCPTCRRCECDEYKETL